MYEEEAMKSFSVMLNIDYKQNVVICILLGAIIILFALHLIESYYANKRIAVLEEEMKKLGEKGEDE